MDSRRVLAHAWFDIRWKRSCDIILANVHFFLEDEAWVKQRWLFYLRNTLRCDIVIGDFNTDMAAVQLPPRSYAVGDWDACVFDESLCISAYESLGMYESSLSDHDGFLLSFIKK